MAEASRPLKLEEFLKKELNTTKCQGLALASGGCISEGRSFDTDHGKIFVKVNAKSEARKMFEGECNSLDAIYLSNTVRVPKPIKVLGNPCGSGAVFVLEHLEMKSLRKCQSQLGTELGR
ncbi:fructosamine 3 kinase [Desmophyllum pertusum]|uniref:protein-ribulosamine 3-kinase n=1 Tax=Desmophyllum pertusum TaxID=174260 RepID=A0A9W9ZTN6_9CNID|nr:fructosamine 3 kinase [Desmophyllum pertusum]